MSTVQLNKMDRVIEAMFDVLPANTSEEIAIKVSKKLGERCSRSFIDIAISDLRKRTEEWGWTIPHVKRGPPKPDEENRFFVMLNDKDGTPSYLDDESRLHIKTGTTSTVATVAQQSTNLAHTLNVAQQYERTKAHRERLEELHADMAYVARKARKMVKEMKAEAKAIKATKTKVA